MAQRTRSDSATKNCTRDDCDLPMRARGVCAKHYKQLRRHLDNKSHHKMYERACATCGGTWLTPRPDARFCTAKCKGVHLSQVSRRKSKLPADHPVMLLIQADRLARADAARVRQQQRQAERSSMAWRTGRQCPGCACWFTPLYTSTTVCCTPRCAARMSRQRRRAREAGARGTFTWQEFMRIAKRFDYCCAYCGVKPERLDPDHVIPLSRGGSNTPSNLLPCCFMCNSSKGAMTLSEWGAWLTDRGQPQRQTTWVMGDPRYVHLTDALLDIQAAA